MNQWVVNISQNDFNKSMESYLSSIKANEEKVKVAKPKKVKLSTNVDIYENTPKESFWKKLFARPDDYNLEEEEFSSSEKQTDEEAAEEYEVLSEIEEKVEKRKESIFARLFKKRHSTAKESDFNEDSVEVYNEYKDSENLAELKNDLKNLGIICYDLMKKLSDDEVKRFKLSEEFATYKEILKKHNLIRVKY